MSSPDSRKSLKEPGSLFRILLKLTWWILALAVVIAFWFLAFKIQKVFGQGPGWHLSNGTAVTYEVEGSNEKTIVSHIPGYILPPSWLPNYPGAQAQADGDELKHETQDTVDGNYTTWTQDSPQKVKEYFESTLQANGFQTSSQATVTDGVESIEIKATDSAGKRELTIKAIPGKDHTTITSTYKGPK
jgi:hypothetical protein